MKWYYQGDAILIRPCSLVWLLVDARPNVATAESRVNNIDVLNNIVQRW